MAFWDKDKLLEAGLICMGKCLLMMCTLGIAPFYPTEAASRGCSPVQIGLVFASLPFIGFFFSPYIGKKISDGISPRSVLAGGLIIEAFFMTAFSFVNILKNANEFFGASLAFRTLQAFGVTSSSVAYNAVASEIFKTRMEFFLPFLEMFAGIGTMVGPTVGGALYQVWGFSAPYTAFCIMIIVLTLCLFGVLPQRAGPTQAGEDSSGNPSRSTKGFYQMICIEIAFDLLVLFFTFVSIAFNDSTLAVKLSDYDLDSFQKGLIFLVSASMYSLSSLLATRISHMFCDPRLWSVCGHVFIGCGWLMMSPNRFIPNPALSHVIAAQAMIGFGAGVFYVVSCNDAYKWMTQKLGFPDDFTSYSLLGGCLQGSYFLGCLVGSAGGGLVIHYFDYNFCTTCLAEITFVAMISLSCVILKNAAVKRSENSCKTEVTLAAGE
ncbi:MFS-type transporter SLC18B1 [Galendromus occidentalis]|uniref:MFS-type transporter SLC18B1 n=1 Tax=Galendromus occidentalis TaxID=34638 RepID=A0AAJ6QSC7_9ACAR|nr:MFS-type transporter SLC18B1 [Galendromus occidentalis]